MEFHFLKPAGLDDQGCCKTCGGLVMEQIHRGIVWPGPCTCDREYEYGALQYVGLPLVAG